LQLYIEPCRIGKGEEISPAPSSSSSASQHRTQTLLPTSSTQLFASTECNLGLYARVRDAYHRSSCQLGPARICQLFAVCNNASNHWSSFYGSMFLCVTVLTGSCGRQREMQYLSRYSQKTVRANGTGGCNIITIKQGIFPVTQLSRQE
jgi:hypothetical protein